MERKRAIVGLAVLVAAGVIAAVMWSGDGDAGEAPIAAVDTEGSSGGSSHGSSGGASGGASAGGPLRTASGRADTLGDGGVRRARVPNPNVGDRPPPTVNTHGELRERAEDAEQSAGWRLGQVRARIELVETRVMHLREAVATVERGGDEAAIERQRTVLRRFEARLNELRAEEPALEAQARQDGTLGDVARGMQEGAAPTLPTRAPPAAP